MTAATCRAVGVDVGTSSLKAVRVASRRNRITVDAECTVPYADGGRPTRDPEAWVRAARGAFEAVWDDAVEAVGFTGQMHGLVPLEAGRPLTEASLWLDVDGYPQLERFLAEHPDVDLVKRTGNIGLPDFTLAKWLLFRERTPELAARVDSLPLPKDFVRDAFTGPASAVTDTNDAAGTQWFDPFGQAWDAGIVAAAGLPPAALRSVVSPATVVGSTGGKGLPDGIPVVAGAGDQATAALAQGGLDPGRGSLSLGTSGVLSVPVTFDQLPTDWDGALHLFPIDSEGGFQVISTIPAFSGALRWAAELMGLDVDGLASLGAEAHGEDRAPSVRFFPFLGGSGAPNADVTKRGQLRGLSDSTTRTDVALAVLTGLAAEVACLVDEVRARGCAIDEIVVGGGLAAVRPLLQLLADHLDIPISRSAVSQGSALGAALLALEGVGLASDVRTPTLSIERSSGTARTIDPRWLAEREEILATQGG